MSTIIKVFFFKWQVLIISAEMGETKNFLSEVINMDQMSYEGSIFAYFIYQN